MQQTVPDQLDIIYKQKVCQTNRTRNKFGVYFLTFETLHNRLSSHPHNTNSCGFNPFVHVFIFSKEVYSPDTEIPVTEDLEFL